MPDAGTVVTELRTPTRRECRHCGRTERWDDEAETWAPATDDGERQVGRVHCVHEWDINGEFAPFGSDGETDA